MMTIRFLKAWNGNYEGTIVDLGGIEEARLTGLGLASYDLDGANSGIHSIAECIYDNNNNIVGLLNSNSSLIQSDDVFPSPLLPESKLRITAAQPVVSKYCKLTSIKCVVATAIALTIYDNQTAAAGTILFTQTFNALDEITFPSGIQAINGIFASWTGTATFDIGAQDAI